MSRFNFCVGMAAIAWVMWVLIAAYLRPEPNELVHLASAPTCTLPRTPAPKTYHPWERAPKGAPDSRTLS